MNNNEHFNRYISSLHHGSDLFSPPSMGLEHEEFSFTSYYSSMHNNAMSNNNQNLHRPYDIESTQSSKICDVPNGVGVVHSAGSLGNRNVLGNSSYAFADFNENTSAWPHFPDTSYSRHSHFDNANYWHQLFQHNNNISEPNVHNLRHPLPPSDPLLSCLSEDDSRGSMYEIDVERSQTTSPEVIQATPIPPTFSSDLFLSQQNYQQPFASVSNDTHQQHQLPIRPIPQQASVVQNYPFVCPECGRYCSSSGGLKRHLEFCHVVRAKLKNKNANHAERTEESESTFHYPYHVDLGPLNLSTDNKIARATPQTAADGVSIQCEPMNSSTNNLFTGGPSLSEENNNVIQSQYHNISANTTVSETAMPTSVLTVLPIPDVQNRLELPIMSVSIASGRDRKCPQCPVILHSERALVEHLLSHNIRQPYECRTCGSRFSRKFHMTRHMKQRGCDGTPRNQFNCEFCGKHFSRKDNLREHVKGHTGQTKKRVKLSCPVPRCEKKLSGKTQLQAHLNVHSDLRPYNCSLDDCNKTFRSNAALKRHLHIHNQGNPFQCPQCDARFGAKHSLDRHIKSHDDKRSINSYESQNCDVPFTPPLTQQKLLDDHIKSHLSNESFECDICYRTYKRHWRLKKHYRQMHHDVNLDDESNSIVADSTLPNVEENQLTYSHECDKCPRKFDKRQALKAHYVTHIQETSLVCTECSRVFIRRGCFLRHLRIKHRLSSEEASEAMKKMNPRIFQDEPVASLSDVSFVDMSACSSSNEIYASVPQDASTALVGEIDASILEGHIIELLSLLVDFGVLRSFGWPNYSADKILQSVLVQCGKEPLTQPDISLVQRLRGNTKILFSFLVDDQTAMENLFSRRPIEQVLQQVIELAKDARSSTNNIVQLPL